MISELDKPTIARVVPKKLNAGTGLASQASTSQKSQIKHSLREGWSRLRTLRKLAYIQLNRQMPCPPRGTVPANQKCGRRLFHSAHPVRPRSWRRPSQLCQPKDTARLPGGNPRVSCASHWKSCKEFNGNGILNYYHFQCEIALLEHKICFDY